MSAAVITASRAEADAAKQGAKAGAKARRRESEESTSQTLAVLKVAADGRSATWQRSYRVDGELRTTTMREHGRRQIDGAELLRLTGEAVRLAADRLAKRHGIPELGPDERTDLRSELVTRLLSDAGPGRLPERQRLTRAYLVKRAEGIVLDDPERQHADADSDGMDPEAIAAAAESRARDRHDRHDPMLNKGIDGTWPEIERGCAALADTGQPLSLKAIRTAAYMVGGGTVRGDWSEAWGTSEGYAATRLVPEGAAQLRDALSALDQSPLYLAIQEAGTKDRDELDHMEAARRWLASGMSDAPRKARAVVERRWRTELQPDEHAPVRVRTDKRLIRTSGRTRKAASDRAGWTAAPK